MEEACFVFLYNSSSQSAEGFCLMMIRRIIILMYQEVAGLVEVVQAFVTKYQFIIPLLPDTSPF